MIKTAKAWHPMLQPYAQRLTELDWEHRPNSTWFDHVVLMTNTSDGRLVGIEISEDETKLTMAIHSATPKGGHVESDLTSVAQLITALNIPSTTEKN